MQFLIIFLKFNFKIVSRLLSLIILDVFSPDNRIDIVLNSLPYKEQSFNWHRFVRLQPAPFCDSYIQTQYLKTTLLL